MGKKTRERGDGCDTGSGYNKSKRNERGAWMINHESITGSDSSQDMLEGS